MTEQDESRPVPKKSAVEIQQDYYEAVGDADWELYEKKDRKYLLQKIAVALVGPPTKEGNLNDLDDLRLAGYEKREEKSTMKVFNKICEYAKYSHNNENIVIAIIRVVCVTPSEPVPFHKITPSDYWMDLQTKRDGVQILIFHVFRLRKCIATKSKEKNCRIFIDHDGRVYKCWDDYLTENKLEECVMVVPKNGEYKGTLGMDIGVDVDPSTVMPLVECQVVPSPALGLGAKILSATDTASTVVNIGALVGVGGALLIPPIAPVAMGVAVGVGVVSGIYSIARSTGNLVDRKLHMQDIGLDNSEARAAWINIMVSTVGISATGASKLLSWAATTGTNVEILMNAVSILQYTNLGTGAIGVVNNLWEMVSKYHTYNETPTALEIFQFTTSVLFLGIGAMSNQTAQEIVQDAQARTINEIRESLPSNVKKKMFDKVSAETRRVQGTIQGNADVIKSLKTIDNKSDFFAKLARINKQLNKNKIRVSLSPDGNPLFNNQHSININDLNALGKKGREQLFKKYGHAKITSRNAATRIYASTSAVNAPISTQNVQFYIRPEEIIKITNFILSLSKIDQEFVAQILSEISGCFHDAFLLLCVELINSLMPVQIDLLASVLDEHYKVKIVLFIFNYVKSKIPVDEDIDITFGNVLHEYISNGKISPKTIIKIKEKLMEDANTSINNDNPNKYDGMHNFFKRKRKLEAGEVITIGDHHILIKGNTVDNLEEWLEMFSQEQCDIFMCLCIKIICNLTISEVDEMIEVNFDEDIILRVVSYLLFESKDGIIDLILSGCHAEILNDDVVSQFKDNMLHWRWIQVIRAYKKCDKCQCICYI